MQFIHARFASAAFAFALLASNAFVRESFAADSPPFAKTTYTYKTVGDVKIQADVYCAKDGTAKPVVVWIHGGALILGSRTSVPAKLLDLCRNEGYALVSIDYRLAPEVKVAAIIDDLRDALRWIREQGPKLFHAQVDRLVVTGGSAGGYLTMMSGFCVEPRPTALVAFWGYGDIDGDWLTKPSEFYRKNTPLISKEETFAAVNHGVLTGTDGDNVDRQGRGRFYRYLRQNGLWAKTVSGFDPQREPKKFAPYCPIHNLSADYPPILMVHGTSDTDVPYEKSADMAKALAKLGRRDELVTVTGAGHGLAGADRKLADAAYAKALAFIKSQLSGAAGKKQN